MSEPTCAVYYWVHDILLVSLFGTEEEAAEHAAAKTRWETGEVQGIQFDDGRYIDRDDWEAYRAEERRQAEKEDQARAEAPLRPPPHHVVPPFDARGQKAVIEGDVPPWLGRSTP